MPSEVLSRMRELEEEASVGDKEVVVISEEWLGVCEKEGGDWE